MTAPTDKIWAYLHNELALEKRKFFEKALKDDPALREALEERRTTHQILTSLKNGTLSNEELEAQLLTEWAAEYPEFAETDKPNRKILHIIGPLAAAAALVVLLAQPVAPIHWQRTAYGSAPQLRGESANQSHYSRSDLKQTARELQNAVEAACDHTEKWTLQISMQELANGLLDIEVSGWPRNGGGSSRLWKKSFQSLENLREKIPGFGKQIANDL